jgi:hypothetical protein
MGIRAFEGISGWVHTGILLLIPLVYVGAVSYFSHQAIEESRVLLEISRFAFYGSDKVLHCVVFGGFSMVLCLSLSRVHGLIFPYSFVFCLAVCFALMDEVHQSFVAGRTFSIFDIVADVVGAGLGILFVKYRRRVVVVCLHITLIALLTVGCVSPTSNEMFDNAQQELVEEGPTSVTSLDEAETKPTKVGDKFVVKLTPSMVTSTPGDILSPTADFATMSVLTPSSEEAQLAVVTAPIEPEVV